MSRIFRSDDVSPGERIVVRRRLGDSFSDVIGHVTGLDPLRVRPQEIGGFPSSLDEVTVPDEEIHIVKRLSPRMIRNSDIRHTETAYAKAFPGIEHTWTQDGQWLMRAGDGVTERSNSATPLGPSAGFGEVPLAEIEAFYARHELPVLLHIPERIGKPAERLVQAGGWTLSPEILVMVRDLADPPTAPDPAELSFSLDPQPDDDWLALYHFRGQELPTQALTLLHDQIDGVMGFARLRTAAGDTVAITRATLTESGDGTLWLGYSAVEVTPAWRRQGLGTRLGAEVLTWGARQGAERAYLQVVAANTAGIGLYRKLGFIEQHRHRYARRDA
ncbi:MAG TPA: GNAT family N-acetyltransferase [Corynebacterium sp.]|nr:GNAT family N-acetyltransferase [Corynebacterium sp.]